MQFCWEFESSSEVRMFVRSSVGTSREVSELAREARRNSPSGSSQVQEFARSPLEHRRCFIGCSPEVHRKKLIETHQEDHREVHELAGSPLEYCREIVESSPEDRQKK